MKSRAAVAWEAGKPLVIEVVDVEGPKNGEVLLGKPRGLPHRRLHSFRAGPRESFQPSWATRAAQSYGVGDGVTSVKPGDHVIPLYRNAASVSFASPAGQICAALSASHRGKGSCPTARPVSPRKENQFTITWGLRHFPNIRSSRRSP